MKTKTFTGVRLKDESQGIVELVFATHLVTSADAATTKDVDKGGDVTLKGAYDSGAEVVISAYGHASWGLGIGMGGSVPQLPVGKGVIQEDGDQVKCEAQFFLNTPGGRDTFETIKALGELQEWSYSLHEVKSHRADVGGKTVNVIEKVKVKEISPVLVGEGINTRTLAAKGASMKQLNSQISEALRNAGRERWGSRTAWVYTEDYDVSEGFAIYCISTDGAPERMVQVDYTVDDAGMATLSDVEVEVEEVTTYAPKGAKFSEHVKAVVAVVDGLTTRAQEVVALRAEKGKSLADESAVLLKQLDGSLGRLREVIDTPSTNTSAAAEYLRFVASTQGVTQ